MLANWITLSRYPLLAGIVALLYLGGPAARLAGAGLLLAGMMLDTVDGVVARRTGQTSLFGSVLDIAADRAYELVLWVIFAHLGMIPVVIPLVVIGRTTLTDALRGIGVAEGTAPFAQHRSPVGRFLVGSPLMRTGYAVTKVVTFCGLAIVLGLEGLPADSAGAALAGPLHRAMLVTAWAALAFCVLRGLPVIVKSLQRFWGTPAPDTQGDALDG
jgi:phosphatidylglycerophosphate synthase